MSVYETRMISEARYGLMTRWQTLCSTEAREDPSAKGRVCESTNETPSPAASEGATYGTSSDQESRPAAWRRWRTASTRLSAGEYPCAAEAARPARCADPSDRH